MTSPPPTRRSALVLAVVGIWVAQVETAAAYCFLNARWSDGRVLMSYNFPPSGPLMNGTSSWEENAEAAMQVWSTIMDGFAFISGGTGPAVHNRRDGVNNMVFGDELDGVPFEPDILALAFTRTNPSGEAVESDIVFNSGIRWDAYNGPLRVDRDGAPTYDFRRVALHELGHVLGLDHPDEACGQSTESIMNARTTDTDELAADDRNAVSFLYADGNQPPLAVAGPNQAGNGTDPFLLDAARSHDADGFIRSYEWRLNGVVVAAELVTTIDLHFGTHVIALTVTDDDGAVDTDTLIIEVGTIPPPTDPENLPPVADGGADRTVSSGELVILDSAGSSDADGTIERYVWSEGSSVLGRDPILPVSLPIGTHEIILTVFDDDAAADSDTVVVIVVFGEAIDTGPIVETTPVQIGPRLPIACGAFGWAMLLLTLVGLRIVDFGLRIGGGAGPYTERDMPVDSGPVTNPGRVRLRRTCFRRSGRSGRRGRRRGSGRV